MFKRAFENILRSITTQNLKATLNGCSCHCHLINSYCRHVSLIKSTKLVWPLVAWRSYQVS